VQTEGLRGEVMEDGGWEEEVEVTLDGNIGGAWTLTGKFRR